MATLLVAIEVRTLGLHATAPNANPELPKLGDGRISLAGSKPVHQLAVFPGITGITGNPCIPGIPASFTGVRCTSDTRSFGMEVTP